MISRGLETDYNHRGKGQKIDRVMPRRNCWDRVSKVMVEVIKLPSRNLLGAKHECLTNREENKGGTRDKMRALPRKMLL